jgi:hypothetical protein
MVKLQGVRYWNLQLGVVILGFSIEMDPNARHCKGMSRLRFVNIRNWDTLESNH